MTPAPAPPAPPPPPPPPPPPKCETLAENCTATGSDTALTLGQRASSFTVPAGWKFANVGDHSVSVSAEGKSLLAAREISDGSEAAVLESLAQLLTASAIEKVKLEALKKRLKKPQSSVAANGVQVELWEVSKSTGNGVNPELHEQGRGTLLVFVARVSPERVVTGVGFVVVPDAEADAEKVMTAVQSLKVER